MTDEEIKQAMFESKFLDNLMVFSYMVNHEKKEISLLPTSPQEAECVTELQADTIEGWEYVTGWSIVRDPKYQEYTRIVDWEEYMDDIEQVW